MKNPRTRIAILTLSLATLVATAGNALALTRFVDENPFFRRSALSGYAGSGVPVGEFESSRIGDGNHETGALDWGVDLEHFFGTRWSLGAFLSNTTYLDKDDPLLETNLTNVGGFLRYVMVSRGGLHPYIRGGVGGQWVQFQDPEYRFKSNSSWMVQAGGGLIIMPFNSLSLNLQAMYNQGFTANTRVPDAELYPDERVVVGFDTQYWSLQVGASVYFQ
jgi:hypothetical protein